MAFVKTLENIYPKLIVARLTHESMFNQAQIRHMKKIIKEFQQREMEMNSIINRMHVMTRRLKKELSVKGSSEV